MRAGACGELGACGKWLVAYRKGLPGLATGLVLVLGTFGWAQPWQRATDGRFIIYTVSSADREVLGAVFAVSQEAARELQQDRGFRLPKIVSVRVYRTLTAFEGATGQPWYVAAVADRDAATLHLQRLRVLSERGSLEATLRHELFHLAQPESWPRWQAEGSAMRFAGERPAAKPLSGLSRANLNKRLAAPNSPEEYARAAATAWRWVGP